jgi:hypothetical protein
VVSRSILGLPEVRPPFLDDLSAAQTSGDRHAGGGRSPKRQASRNHFVMNYRAQDDPDEDTDDDGFYEENEDDDSDDADEDDDDDEDVETWQVSGLIPRR